MHLCRDSKGAPINKIFARWVSGTIWNWSGRTLKVIISLPEWKLFFLFVFTSFRKHPIVLDALHIYRKWSRTRRMDNVCCLMDSKVFFLGRTLQPIPHVNGVVKVIEPIWEWSLCIVAVVHLISVIFYSICFHFGRPMYYRRTKKGVAVLNYSTLRVFGLPSTSFSDANTHSEYGNIIFPCLERRQYDTAFVPGSDKILIRRVSVQFQSILNSQHRPFQKELTVTRPLSRRSTGIGSIHNFFTSKFIMKSNMVFYRFIHGPEDFNVFPVSK